MIKLDILSDPICPWCYIGKAQLDRALVERPDHPLTIEWHPFQLNPDMPDQGMGRQDYLDTKFGGRENANSVYGRIADAAAAAGLSIDFEKIQRTPNTLDAHRLIHWAGLEGRQTAVVSALFRAYFEDGKDIGDHAVLLDIAEAAEMDRDVVQRLLNGTSDRDDISARDANAREKGVTGVPTFVLANQHVLPGAQPTGLWEQVLTEIDEQMSKQENVEPDAT